MLEVVVVLAIIALVLLFLRAGRQNTIVYRKKVAPADREYSIRDHPGAFDQSAASNYYTDNAPSSDHTFQDALAFQGGEFGGGGAGDSYDIGTVDPMGNAFADFDMNTGEISNSYTEGGDFSSDDSGTSDSGSSDSGSDSSGDCTSFSGD